MLYAERVEALEAEGLTTSDAQAVIDAEEMKNRETITKGVQTMEITGYLIKAAEPFRGHTQSILYRDEDGIERVAYTGRPSVTQGAVVLQERTPDLTLAEYEAERGQVFKRITKEELDALNEAHVASLITEPEPMSEERYNELLEVLPPCRWATVGGAETFHISERLTGNLVQWCIKFPSGECYGMTQAASISKEALADKVRGAWYDKTARAQARAHGVQPETWGKLIGDCAAITETDEIDGRI